LQFDFRVNVYTLIPVNQSEEKASEEAKVRTQLENLVKETLQENNNLQTKFQVIMSDYFCRFTVSLFYREPDDFSCSNKIPLVFVITN